jgi:hypothetical protein
MNEFAHKIQLIDKLLNALGERENFRKCYTESIGKLQQDNGKRLCSLLLERENYLGMLVEEDLLSILLLLDHSGIKPCMNVEESYFHQTQDEGNVMWVEGYDNDEDCIIHFLQFTNNFTAGDMKNIAERLQPDSKDSLPCRTEDYVAVWNVLSGDGKALVINWIDNNSSSNIYG